MGTAGRNLLLAAVAVAGIGCGPIEYVNEVTRKASTEVESAEAVANEEDAHYRYWYTLAVEYLKKARVEASYADYQAANRFGRKAAFAAEKARETAMRSAADPASMVRTPPDIEEASGDGFSDVPGDDDAGDDAP